MGELHKGQQKTRETNSTVLSPGIEPRLVVIGYYSGSVPKKIS